MSSAAMHINRQPSRLLSFPAELVAKVLWQLDSQSLLAIKLTCRTLYQATKSRQFWYHFVGDFEAITGEYPLEQPLTDYTVEELEQWTLQRLKIKEKWQLPELPTFTLREIDAEEYNEGILLPGGRWLVGWMIYHRFLVWDLDEPDLDPQVLFGELDVGQEDILNPWDEVTDFSLWVDPSTQCLTFHVAIYNADYQPIQVDDYTTIYIYRVELEGHGAEALFWSTRLACMHNSAEGNKHAVLDGRRYIEMNTFEPLAFQSSQEVTVELHVYPYSDTRRPSDVKAKVFTTPIHAGGTLRRLSADYIGVETYSNLLYVYSVAQLDESDSCSTLIPLYQIQLSLHSPLSPSLAPSCTLSFLASDSNGDLGVAEWLHDFSLPPSIRRIDKTISITTGIAAYGPSLAIFINEKSFEMLLFAWDHNRDRYLVERKRARGVPKVFELMDGDVQDSTIDEISGRILVRTFGTWIILDVAT